MTERTHFVYEAYDADGVALYVGCTKDPATRYKAHMSGQSDARGWFDPFVTNWRVSGPYVKEFARAREKERIYELQPIFNGVSRRNFGGARELIKEYLAHHNVRFEATRYGSRLVPVETGGAA